MITQQDVSNAEYHYRESCKQWVLAKQKLNLLIKDLHSYKGVLSSKDYHKVKTLTKPARIKAQDNLLEAFLYKQRMHERKEEVNQEYHSGQNTDKEQRLQCVVATITNSLTFEQLKLLVDNQKHIQSELTSVHLTRVNLNNKKRVQQ